MNDLLGLVEQHVRESRAELADIEHASGRLVRHLDEIDRLLRQLGTTENPVAAGASAQDAHGKGLTGKLQAVGLQLDIQVLGAKYSAQRIELALGQSQVSTIDEAAHFAFAPTAQRDQPTVMRFQIEQRQAATAPCRTVLRRHQPAQVAVALAALAQKTEWSAIDDDLSTEDRGQSFLTCCFVKARQARGISRIDQPDGLISR